MADGPPEEKPQDAPSIPEVLTLSTFFKSDKLCDCTVKLPDVENSLAEDTKGDVQKDDEQTGEPKLREWRCHKVVLASASNWFYKQFVSEGKEEVVIPELPDDPVVRRTVILEDLIPLALRYMYAGQSWDEIFPEVLDPQGLFVVACTLEVRNLANKVLSYISDEILDDEHMMELLYQGVQLGKEGEELVSKAAEAIRGNFSHVCANPADCDLFTKLPVEVIERLLEGDDLQVKNEEEVFRVVQHTLRRRLKRQERLLIMQDIGVSEGEHFSDVTLELTASETLHALGQEEAPKPDVPKYSVKSDPIKVEGKGHCTFADCTLRLRIPSASTSTPKIAFRVVQDGKVVAEVVLPDEVCDDDKAPAEAQPSLTGDTAAPDARKENAEATPGLFKCALAMGIQAFGQVWS